MKTEYIESLPLFKCLADDFSIENYQPAMAKLEKFEHIIHLGTGGSSLGPQALYATVDNPARSFTFFDNIDPDGIVKQIREVDFSLTGLLVVSKSGNTAETLVQLATFKKIYDDKGLNLKDHMVIITQVDDNALHTFAKQNAIVVLAHNNQIGGRYAVFAEVGILPGMLMGLDMAEFRNGVTEAVGSFKSDAAGFLAQSKFNPVMFSYSCKLQKFTSWFAQLWAESLGKKNQEGARFGSTPIQALGVTDQHSQLQLYIDGPQDKFFTFLEVIDHAHLGVADLGIDHPHYNGLRGHNLKDLLKAELDATYQTLGSHELPQRLITIPTVSPYYLGQLMINAVLETLYVAKIWDVNPFDQPAVEEGKILALKFLKNAA